MIIIEVISSKYKFKYEGAIELWLDEPFLTIKADKIIHDIDTISGSSSLTIDKFWLSDLREIKGIENDNTI